METQELIVGLQRGSETAFRHLVDTYQRRVYNTVLAIVQHPDDADDVTQEVFVTVFEAIKQFRGDAQLSTWLYRIATTRALEAYRKKHARKRFAFLTSLFGGDDGEDSGERLHPVEFDHPGIQLEQQERARVLFAAINRLSDQQKVAFTLHHVEGLSYQEITEVMQTSLSSVESLLFRAKQNLKKQLHSYYYSA